MGGGMRKSARVSFTKSGVIQFSPSASELMGIKSGDKITLAQDEEDAHNWYFFKDSQHGFELRAGYKDAGCMFNHRGLVHELLGAFGKPEDVTHKFLIAGEPTVMKGDKTKYWGILI